MAKTKSAPKKTTRKAVVTKAPTPIMREGTKQKLIVDLLSRPNGATIAEMAEATGWQSHTVRGVLAGPLKKKLGLTIVSEKIEERGSLPIHPEPQHWNHESSYASRYILRDL